MPPAQGTVLSTRGNGRTPLAPDWHRQSAPALSGVATPADARARYNEHGFGVSSATVRLASPQLLRDEGIFEELSPVYIVGGGRLGLATAHALASHARGRWIQIIEGRVSVVSELTELTSRSLRPQSSLASLASAVLDFTSRYFCGSGGPISKHVSWFKNRSVQQDRRFAVRALHGVVEGFLQDVVDTPAGPEMVLRGGGRLPINPNSVFVDCTGKLPSANWGAAVGDRSLQPTQIDWWQRKHDVQVLSFDEQLDDSPLWLFALSRTKRSFPMFPVLFNLAISTIGLGFAFRQTSHEQCD